MIVNVGGREVRVCGRRCAAAVETLFECERYDAASMMRWELLIDARCAASVRCRTCAQCGRDLEPVVVVAPKAQCGYNDGLSRRQIGFVLLGFIVLVILLGIVNSDDLDGRRDPGYRDAPVQEP